MIVAAGIAALFGASLASCGAEWTRFELQGNRDRNDALAIVRDRDASPESRFAAVRLIASEFLENRDYSAVIDLLATFVERYPDDPYKAWHLLTTGLCYEELGSPRIAAAYYDRVVRSCPDLAVDARSIHLRCLERLVAIATDPAVRIGYLTQLIDNFPQETNQSAMLFRLGKEYERIGEWRLALRAYARFLPFAGTEIPEYPDAFAYARRMIDFDSGAKEWAWESIDGLVAAIKDATEKRDVARLERFRSKIGFFVLSWKQLETGIPPRAEFSIESFFPEPPVGANPKDYQIKFASGVDPMSNPTEVYLKSEGWETPDRVWYFYFRKINFPADIDVHGRWEWLGIYIGEVK